MQIIKAASLETKGKKMKPPTNLRAPVLIGTHNRINHFKSLINSLRACYWAPGTELYIAIDAPYSDDVRKVNHEIREFAESISGFSRVHLLIRTENLGPEKNFGKAQEEIFREHDVLILLEDDNVVAKNFLVYMNEALDHFKDDPKCYAICGYHFMSARYEKARTDIYCAPYQSAWGVGYFKNKYTHPHLIPYRRPDSYFLNPLNLIRAHWYAPHIFPMYMGGYLAGKGFGDTMHSLHCLKKRLICVYPKSTKVINNGWDGTGIHCGRMEYQHPNNFDDQEQTFFDFELNPKLNIVYILKNRKWFKQNIKIDTLKWLYAYLMYLAGFLLGRKQLIRARDLVRLYF